MTDVFTMRLDQLNVALENVHRATRSTEDAARACQKIDIWRESLQGLAEYLSRKGDAHAIKSRQRVLDIYETSKVEGIDIRLDPPIL